MAEYQRHIMNVSAFVVDVNIRIRIIVVRQLLKYAASASNFVSVDGRNGLEVSAKHVLSSPASREILNKL